MLARTRVLAILAAMLWLSMASGCAAIALYDAVDHYVDHHHK